MIDLQKLIQKVSYLVFTFDLKIPKMNPNLPLLPSGL